MFIAYHQNAWHNNNLIIADKSFENVQSSNVRG